MINVSALVPAQGDLSKDIVLEVQGSGFTVSTQIELINPANEALVYPLTSISLVSDSIIRGTIAALTVPVGIYTVRVYNSATDSFRVEQSYRSAPQLPQNPFTDQKFENLMDRFLGNLNPVDDPNKYDLSRGQVPWDMAAPLMVIIEGIYLSIYQAQMQTFAQYMGGAYLDLRAEEHGVVRKMPTKSSTALEITSAPGTIIPTAIIVSTTKPANTEEPAKSFISTETAEKTYKDPVTGTATSGTTVSLVDTTKSFTVNEWVDHYLRITGGKGVGQVRRVSSNTATEVVITEAWIVGSEPDNTSVYRLFTGISIEAENPGSDYNVAANTIDRLLTPVAHVTAVNNPIAATGGTDRETDKELLSRFLLTVRSPSAGGTIDDYIRWALETPGTDLGSIGVIPLWNGNGTVKVMIINEDNTIPNAATVQLVQNYIDPTPGQGEGKAPIGATVTVQAVTPILIDVKFAMTGESTYGNALVRTKAQEAIEKYLEDLPVGEDVKFWEIQHAAIHDTEGVATFDMISAGNGIKKSTDASYVTTDIPIAGTEKALVGTITIT